MDTKPKASEEQLAYADFLGMGSMTGLGILIVTFLVYISGLLPNVIDFGKLQEFWKLSASAYVHEANAPTGWQWAGMLKNGDMLNYVGVALLAGMTLLSYFRIIPIFIRKKDTAYLVITLVEIGILTLAASGILTAGGH